MVTGYAISTYSSKGFSGIIRLAAGFKPDGTIIQHISYYNKRRHLVSGTKMAEPLFKNQFIDKNPSVFSLKVKKDGGPVDAISAATISSRAFCDAVQRAYNTLKKGGFK